MSEEEKLLRQLFGDEVVERPERARNLDPLFPLSQIWPDFGQRLKNMLTQAGENKLAATVNDLEVFDRCRCGSDDCATVYTKPRPLGSYGDAHRNIVFWNADMVNLETGERNGDISDYPTAEFTTILDVVGDAIMCIEILSDLEGRRRLIEALPDSDPSDEQFSV